MAKEKRGDERQALPAVVRAGVTIPFDSGSWPWQKSGLKPYEPAKRTYAGVGTTMLATTPPFRQPMRSASTTFGTPPSASKQRADISKVVGAFVPGETHEPPARVGHHCAEDMEAAFLAPVDDEHLAWRPDPRPSSPMVAGVPVMLRLGDQTAELAGRARAAGRPGLGEQTLGRYAARSLAHPVGDHVGHHVVVVLASTPGRPDGPASTARFTVLVATPQMAAAPR